MKLELWFEFASTYSYPAVMRIGAAATQARVEVEWKAFLLGPIFQQLGWNDSPFNLQPAKGRYMWRDLERICAAGGLPFQRPSQFPRNGLLAARVAAAHQDQPWIGQFVERVYRANFAEDRDISQAEVIASCLDGLGLPSADVLTTATSAAAKQRLREQTDEAVEKGIFGAPSFWADGELFWGNDRLEQAIAAARGWPALAQLPRSEPPRAIEAIEADTRQIGFDMASDRATGELLRALVASKPDGRILEIGTGTGLATAWLADGMNDRGALLSIDSDPAVVEVARRHLGNDRRITFEVGDGADILGRIEGRFDLIFADAWPGKFSHLEEALGLLARGGLYVIDDLLPQPNWPDGHGAKVDALLRDLGSRPGLTISHLDWSTGITIVAKRGSLVPPPYQGGG